MLNQLIRRRKDGNVAIPQYYTILYRMPPSHLAGATSLDDRYSLC
uniref:Uncharacterized protein n=1 Tax=Picea glauca TaxID=3330 RepID=A0A101LWD9_PICGL|nr:hypothetical protein ABT39_MTgene1696 [Picea glauca]